MDLSTREGRREQGERIKQAAREAGMSLDELARRIGCSRALIFQYASGASLIQTDRLQQIAQTVGRPLPWFFSDSTSEDSLLSLSPTNLSGNQPDTPISDIATGEGTSPYSLPDSSPSVASLQIELQKERERLQEEREQLSQELARERTRFDQRRLRDDIAHLEALLGAHSSPPDYRKVVECCQQLQPLLARDDDPERLAALLFQHGNALLRLQEWGAAKERLEQATGLYRQADKPVAARDCMQSMGHANLMLGRVEEALEQFAYVASGEDWMNRWQGTLSMGAAHELLGNYPAAIAAFEQAIQIVEERETANIGTTSTEARKATEVARLYIEANWANLELDFGDYESAGARALRCIRTAQRHGIQDQYLEALLTAGVAALHLLELRDALRNIQQALDVAELASDQQHTSLALSCMSLYATTCHRHEEAIVAGKEALALALRCNAVRAEVLAQRALCEAYLSASNPAEALYHAQQGLATATNMRLHLPQAQFELLKARGHYLASQLPEALATNGRARQLAEELQVRPLQQECLQLQAQICFAQQRWEDALQLAHTAQTFQSTTRDLVPNWQPLAIVARALHRLNNLAEADTFYTRALSRLNGVRQRLIASGEEDNLLENRDALELWQDRIRLLLETVGEEVARQEAVNACWPPLLDSIPVT